MIKPCFLMTAYKTMQCHVKPNAKTTMCVVSTATGDTVCSPASKLALSTSLRGQKPCSSVCGSQPVSQFRVHYSLPCCLSFVFHQFLKASSVSLAADFDNMFTCSVPHFVCLWREAELIHLHSWHQLEAATLNRNNEAVGNITQRLWGPTKQRDRLCMGLLDPPRI